MKFSFSAGAITEKYNRDSVIAFQLSGQGTACRNGKTSAYNTVRAQHTYLKISNMHGTALALAVPGLLPEYLRHHSFHVGTFCNTVPVSPVIADYTVINSQMGTYTYRDSLLTYVGVDKAIEIPIIILLNRPFLKAADGQHLSKHYFQIFVFYWQNFPPSFFFYQF
jgi:hypothetical protein